MSWLLGVLEVRWERMYPDELKRVFRRCPLAWFPYGLCEPHGPQSILDCARILICRRAATAHGGIVVPLHYLHIHEDWRLRHLGES